MSAPGPPVLQLRPRTSTGTARFWWSPPLSDGGSAITGYRLSYDSTQISVGNGESYTLTGLTDGVDYAFSLAAENINGFGPEAYFRVVQCGDKPSAVTSATYTSDASGSFTASWTIPTSDGGAAIRWNVASCYPIDSAEQAVKRSLYGGTTASARVDGLNPNKSYQVLLQAVNDPGYSPPTSYLDTTVSAFDPRSVGTAALWLDASAPLSLLDANSNLVVRTGNPVRTWKDLINDYSFTAGGTGDITYSKTSLNGYPALVFTDTRTDGIDFGIPGGSPLITSDNMTLFMVFQVTQPAGYPALFLLKGDADFITVLKGGGSASELLCSIDHLPGEFVYPTGLVQGTPTLLTGYADFAKYVFQITGPIADLSGSQLRNGTNLNTLGNLAIGKALFSGTYSASISEILIYDGLLNAGQRQTVQAYLSQKWGIVPPSLRVYLEASNIVLDKGSFSSWPDSGPYNITGVALENGTAAIDGGIAAILDGSTNYTIPSLGSLSNFTVNVWYKEQGTAAYESPCILSELWTGGSINYTITRGQVIESGKWACGFFDSVTGWNFGTAFTLPMNTWINIQYTWDGADIKTYINGSIIGTVNHSGSTASCTGNPIRLGRRWDNPEYMTGLLGEVRIYNKARTGAEILADYNASSGIFV